MVRDVRRILMGILWIALALAIATVALYMPVSDGMHYSTDRLFVLTSILVVLSLPFVILKPKAIKWGLVDVLLLIIATLYVVSTVVNQSKAFPALLQEAFPYICLYFSVKVFVSLGGKRAEQMLKMY